MHDIISIYYAEVYPVDTYTVLNYIHVFPYHTYTLYLWRLAGKKLLCFIVSAIEMQYARMDTRND